MPAFIGLVSPSSSKYFNLQPEPNVIAKVTSNKVGLQLANPTVIALNGKEEGEALRANEDGSVTIPANKFVKLRFGMFRPSIREVFVGVSCLTLKETAVVGATEIYEARREGEPVELCVTLLTVKATTIPAGEPIVTLHVVD